MKEIDDAVVEQIAQPNRVMAPVMWYGGKGNLARRLMPHLPPGKVYVEPYCGAASMFWHLQEPRPVEVLNDLDGEIINLFRCLQDKAAFEELMHRLIWTPYSLDEFRRALQTPLDAPPIDRAWALFVRQNQGFGGVAETEGHWGRTFTSTRGMAGLASNFRGRIKLLTRWHDRLTRVQLDSRDALKVIRYWDSADTVFYLDPPYVTGTRVKGTTDVYSHEQDDEHHAELVELLLSIEGQAMLSGYAHEIYVPLEHAGWERIELATTSSAASRGRGTKLRGKGSALEHAKRTEVIWVKKNTQ
jgi:DNA adenine methylase